MKIAPLDDDFLDSLDLEEGEEDDVDSGTEAFMRVRQQGASNARAVRPASANLTRQSDSRQRGAPASRPSERPASASFAVIHERRERDRAKRPSSAAPLHSAPQHKYAVARAASDSNERSAAGRMPNGPVVASERANLRPASASFTRPASASVTRPGSARPMTASKIRPASANIARQTSQDLQKDEMARSYQVEEREILDILSDHSDYESDLELEAETRALNKQPSLHRSQNASGLEAKRAQLLARTEIGLDHSLYESDENADTRGVKEREVKSSAPLGESRDRYPTLEEITARVNDHQYQGRQLVQEMSSRQRPQRPSDGSRAQRPSDKARAPSLPVRPSDKSARSTNRRSSFAPPGRLHEEVPSQSDSEYESDHVNPQDKPLSDDMSGTLKWLEDGLTTRQD